MHMARSAMSPRCRTCRDLCSRRRWTCHVEQVNLQVLRRAGAPADPIHVPEMTTTHEHGTQMTPRTLAARFAVCATALCAISTLPAAAQNAPAAPAAARSALPADPWPRKVDLANASVLVYQPQVNTWERQSARFSRGGRDPAGRRERGNVRRDLRNCTHASGPRRAHRRVREPQGHEVRLSDAAQSRRRLRCRAAEERGQRHSHDLPSTGSRHRSPRRASSRPRSPSATTRHGSSSAIHRRSSSRSTARPC